MSRCVETEIYHLEIKISQFCKRDPTSKLANERFRYATDATRRVFEDALEAGRE